jgi:hypothetical protein
MTRDMTCRVAAAVLVAALACGCSPPGKKAVWRPAESTPFSPGKSHVDLLFVGDFSVARGIAEGVTKVGKGDYAWPFQDIKPTLDAADLVFGNLEFVIADTDEGKTGKTYTIRAPTANASVLKQTGFDVVSVANNHALDFSHGGFWSTLQEASKQGLLLTGVQEETGQKPQIVEVGQMKVGFLAFNAHGDEWKHPDLYPRPALYKTADAVAAVKKLRPLVDVVVISLHWGPELSFVPWDWQIKDAHALVDAGADFVIGQHPHVPQPVEEYKGALIAYSLGDFLFDKQSPWLRHRTGDRFFLKVGFDGKKRTSAELLPINHDAWWRPHLQPGQDTQSWWMKPSTSAWTTSDALPKASVARVTADGKATPCDDWLTKRPVLPGGYLRWLERRWACGQEDNAAARAVSATGDTAGTVFREGVWAVPVNDTVRVTYSGVPFASKLVGWAAYTDWVVDNELTQKAPVTAPARLVVKSGDVTLLSTEVAFEKRWHEIEIDTSKLTGTKGELVVEVQGPKRDEPGFLFELRVPKP